MSHVHHKKTISFLFSKEMTTHLILFFVLALALWGAYSTGSIIFFVVMALASIFLMYVSAKISVSYISIAQEHKIISQEFDTLVHDLKDGVIIYSPQFEIIHMNPEAEKIFGITAEKYIGTRIRPETSSHPELRILAQTIFPSLASSVLQMSEANEWPQLVDVLIDNPEMKFHTVLSRITDANGKILFFIKIIKDETRERAILRNKNEFINTAAHQLRTPLTAINWALESIKETSKGVSQDIESVAGEALGVSERALKITNDLLDVAKMEEGKFGYKFEKQDLVGFVNEVVSTLKTVASQKNISLSFNHSEEEFIAPRIDKERLGMALFNLIDNAIKYTLQNGIVKVRLTKDNSFAYIEISDSGVGIAQEDIEKLFKKFFRGSNVEQLEPNGNGLGLFITKNIIERHGGEISVVSQLNRGTTFRFSIPLHSNLVPEFEKGPMYQDGI